MSKPAAKKEAPKPKPKAAGPAPAAIPNSMKFLFGGLSGIGATCIVQPLDLVKTRMQLQGTTREYANSVDCLKKVIKNEGPLSLYKGLGAALLRQATYTTGRLGTYTYLVDSYKLKHGVEPPLFYSMLMGMAAGGVGACIGNPAELVLIRMTADGKLPANERRNYKNVANAVSRIVAEEGVLTLWRGCIPTIGRAMVVNMVQLASYTQAKTYIHQAFKMPEGIKLHFWASMFSGLLTTIASMPVDIAKTRIQNQKIVNGKGEYKGTMDVLMKITKTEGFLSLWKGFTPYYCRLGPHTVLTFIFLEQMNTLYRESLKPKPKPKAPSKK